MSNENAVGALMDGLLSGASKRADIDNQKAQAELAAAQAARASVAGYAPQAQGAPSAPAGDAGAGKAVATADPVNADLAPHQRAFLNAVSAGESGGKYNIRYDGGAGSTFGDFAQHPGIFAKTPDGKLSSAAGRYMFTKSTWDSMGGGDFSPANQDTKAWQLATQRYAATTGRNLDTDLQNGGLNQSILTALSPTWAAFKSKQGDKIATYNDSLSRYSSGKARSIQPSAPAANPASGAINIMQSILQQPTARGVN